MMITSTMSRTEAIRKARRVVVKVGSNILTGPSGLNIEVVRSISAQLCWLCDQEIQVVLVTSGAVSAGMRKIGLTKKPSSIPERQAAAAAGQAVLMMEYEHAFDLHGKKVAQILLTAEDMNSRKRYLNARNTIHTLLDWKIVPVINENDTVSIDEIKLGDNDNLSALVAMMVDADLLINLTDIDGLYDKDPRTNHDAVLLSEVNKMTSELEDMASGAGSSIGTGGMLTKIKAARKATGSGIPMLIAKGSQSGILRDIFNGVNCGTYFRPSELKPSAKKSWIAFTVKPKGTIVLDDGAVKAVMVNGKSLLPSGIVEVINDFGVGAPVEIIDRSGNVLGTGLVNYSSSNIRCIMGLKSTAIEDVLGEKPYDEVIHRDNMSISGTDY
ncbi:glutamate 5-kinase [Desulforegula conservatrix]|uniref:glutamate 5-kinase n=1 Tax=Desulforegula conservatrix TaxID=153026 RepID=UPI001E51AB6D|nr:glutamate 5-kinase [Desulforegula conservatrix]